MGFPASPDWRAPVVVGGPSPLLAEGPWCGSRPFLAGGRCRWWLVFPRHSWLRAPGAVPGHSWLGPLWCWCVVPGHSWLRVVLVAVPRHSWLGSAGRSGGGGPFPWGWVGGFPCCVCLWRGACAWCMCLCVFCLFVVSVLVVVRVCLPRVLVCVCVCVCVVCWWSVIACPRFPRLGLAAGVRVRVAGVCCGWSLATPG